MTPTPDERLAGFLDELEHQAAGAWAAERGHEVLERAQAEYSRVSLAARLMASVDSAVEIGVLGVGPMTGTLLRVADGWCLVGIGPTRWVVRLAAVQVVRGGAARAVAPEAWPVTARLGLGSALRGLAGERCVARFLDGGRAEGVLRRVGADFVELQAPDGRIDLLAFSGLAAVGT